LAVVIIVSQASQLHVREPYAVQS